MAKIDFKKTLKHLYKPSKSKFSIVDVPSMNFLMLDGHGDPNTTSEYQDTVEALYAVAYTLRFKLKAQGYEYVVPPLEGLWWTKDMATFSLDHKEAWDWTMMIMQPEKVTQALFKTARTETNAKKNLPALPNLRLETYAEGLAVQILYIGPYDDERDTIARMHQYIHTEGYVPNGKHHEIYLSDPRRTDPEKLKTIIRQPIRAE